MCADIREGPRMKTRGWDQYHKNRSQAALQYRQKIHKSDFLIGIWLRNTVVRDFNHDVAPRQRQDQIKPFGHQVQSLGA